MPSDTVLRDPFGLPDCESEVKLLKGKYSELFFDETPFNRPAMARTAYLIVGRRGSGKTALAQYFSFQNELPNPYYIDVDEPAAYQEVLIELSRRATLTSEVMIPNLVKVWEFVIWTTIFRELAKSDGRFRLTGNVESHAKKPSGFINDTLQWLAKHLLPENEAGAFSRLGKLVEADEFTQLKQLAANLAGKRPIIFACDTLEKVDVSSEHMMQAMAALIQTAADFNLEFSDRGIHIKIFIPGEVFPYLNEVVILNPAKSLREDPVYLLWRPKDLLRLISWRFFKFLQARDLLLPESKGKINWDSHQDVIRKMWLPYFGKDLENNRGLRENTWPYVLRHTQMRPRQLITLCNAIARRSLQGDRFPHFSGADIRGAVRDAEINLANEIVNSFSTVYPKISRIIDALMGAPMIFSGSDLDKRAKLTKSEWPAGAYSLNNFRQLLAEVGIVGRVNRQNTRNGYVDADFEYSTTERLPLISQDTCVIHPMFYRRLNVDFNQEVRVMPFSTERDADGF